MTIGFPPQSGFELIEGRFVNGITQGSNLVYQSGLTAKASGTQSNGTLVPANVKLVEFDTVATTGDSCVLPLADNLGVEIVIMNNGAATLDVYSNTATNPVTAAADTLNGSTSSAVTIAANSLKHFACAKAGVWIAA